MLRRRERGHPWLFQPWVAHDNTPYGFLFSVPDGNRRFILAGRWNLSLEHEQRRGTRNAAVGVHPRSR